MFYNLLFPLTEHVGFFNLFQYITVRAGGALGTAFVLSLLFGPLLINAFRGWQKGAVTVKEILPHEIKAGTPTMGGVLVLGTFVFSALLWTDLTNPYVWLLLSVVIGFGAIGFLDDWLAMTRRWKHGIPGKYRLLMQFSLAIVFVLFTTKLVGGSDVAVTDIYFPFFKGLIVSLGLVGFVAFGSFIMVGAANAVNITDGLDGLVSIPAVIVAASFAVLAYVAGRVDYTAYLGLPYIVGASDIAIMCAALAGSVLGFLWFNAPPARIFLGDTGSLAIGAFLGAVAIVIKQEFALAIIGGLFVLETVSVIVQVISFKTTGKRVFKMAPLHHHFEQLGWPESTIVIRFWIISFMLALIGLATLKLR